MDGDDTEPRPVPCGICGGRTRPAFATRDHNRRLTDAEFRYVRCDQCGTIALRDVPGDLAAFYTGDYYRLPGSRAELLASVGPAEWEKLSLVRRFVPGGRLLEIGPAAGAFLAVALDAGFEVEAIEMDEACCRFLEAELGVRVRRSDDPPAALADGKRFDAIVLWHVIEHVRDPAAVISAVAEALAPGGVAVLGSPNPLSLELRVLRSRWAHVDAPRHVHLLPARVLVRLGARAGLEPVLQTTNGPGALDYARCGWCDSLTNTARRRASFRVRRGVGAALVRLGAPVERRLDRGPAYTLVLRRG